MSVTDDRHWLARAIRLAMEGVDCGAGGPFGAVVTRGSQVLGEGSNQVLAQCDPTAHAEVVALRRACAHAGDFHLPGATLYTSCEPCPMCLAAAYWAHVERIVFAATRDDASKSGFDDTLIYHEVGLPLAQRRLPMSHLPVDEAQAPFERWLARAQRTPY